MRFLLRVYHYYGLLCALKNLGYDFRGCGYWEHPAQIQLPLRNREIQFLIGDIGGHRGH